MAPPKVRYELGPGNANARRDVMNEMPALMTTLKLTNLTPSQISSLDLPLLTSMDPSITQPNDWTMLNWEDLLNFLGDYPTIM
jgi:hypothetical protein